MNNYDKPYQVWVRLNGPWHYSASYRDKDKAERCAVFWIQAVQGLEAEVRDTVTKGRMV